MSADAPGWPLTHCGASSAIECFQTPIDSIGRRRRRRRKRGGSQVRARADMKESMEGGRSLCDVTGAQGIRPAVSRPERVAGGGGGGGGG